MTGWQLAGGHRIAPPTHPATLSGRAQFRCFMPNEPWCQPQNSSPRAGSRAGAQPLLGISVFAALDMPLNDLLSRRFASFRTVYLPTAGRLAECQFELLPTGRRPHFTVRLRRAEDSELGRLLAALGAAEPNPQYARGMIQREEG